MHQPTNPTHYNCHVLYLNHFECSLLWEASSVLLPVPSPGHGPLLILLTVPATLQRADRSPCFPCWTVSYLSMVASSLWSVLPQLCSELFHTYWMELNYWLCLEEEEVKCEVFPSLKEHE